MTLALYRYQLPFTQPLTFHGKVEVAREGLLVRINDGWGKLPPARLLERESATGRGRSPCHAGGPCRRRHPEPRAAVGAIWPRLRAPDMARTEQPAAGTLSPHSRLPQELLRNWKEWLHRTPGKAKLKVARYPMRDELALIRLLCDRLPSLKLVLDANQGWTREEAWTFCGHLDPNRIEYLEDPCADFADIAFVANRTGMPVALDELLAQGKPWEPIPQLRALVLKPTLLGSLANCEALIARARELRLKVIISSCFESDLGLNQLFHLAGEWAPEQAPGLDTRRWMAGNLQGKMANRI